MKKRKLRQRKSYAITKNIKPNKRSRYNVMSEHNYFHDIEKKKCRWPDEYEYSNHTEIITNNHDKCDSIPDWYAGESSSEEESDTKDMLLSDILKKEFQKYLLNNFKNLNYTNGLSLLREDQMFKESNNTNNHDLSNMPNDSSTEFQANLCDQSCMKFITENNLTHDELLSNGSTNIKARKDSHDNNLQNYLLSSSLHLSNSLLVRKACPSFNNADLTNTNTPTNNVCPPLHWIHLIYLAIKNSATENVTCYDIQRIVRCWFPYYCLKSYIKFIRIILSHINHNCQKYFHCNSFTTMIHKDDTWTINSIYKNTLEESLMKIVENNEDEIKSAMTHPDKLSTILNGYGVLYLGCDQNSIKK